MDNTRPKTIVEEGLEELKQLVLLRRRRIITKKEYREKLREIEKRLGL